MVAATLNLYNVGLIERSSVSFLKPECVITLRESDTMLLYACVAYLVSFKCPDLETIKFEYYQPKFVQSGRYFCQQTASHQMFV
jgi:hypothetical protein